MMELITDAIRAKEEAMARVDIAALEAWKAAHMEALGALYLEHGPGYEFMCEEVMERMEVTTHELRAAGPRMVIYARDRLIEKVGVGQGKNPKHHAAHKSIWRFTDWASLCWASL